MDFRTDLALEMAENIDISNTKGVIVDKYKNGNCNITEIEIVDAQGSEKVKKPIGKYITIELPEFSHDSEIFDERLKIVSDLLKKLLPKNENGILVSGLGNDTITPDALGPKSAKRVFSTRHIDNKLKSELGFCELNPVSAITFGVLGQTGIESCEIIKGIVDTTKPSAVIIVDALASREISRLGTTVQITNTGITPGSGVGNARAEISEKTLGVPVIAIGVPTVVDAITLINDLTIKREFDEEIKTASADMMITPREIDVIIERASRFLGLSINCALQPSIEPEILFNIV
ncbi:MAG: GPR endopeptidase [Oscillospiraceae bacterium]